MSTVSGVEKIVEARSPALVVDPRALFPALETGRDHCHTDLVAHGVVDHGAEDDVGVRVGHGVDDLGSLVHLEKAQVRASGNVQDQAAGTLDGGLEQRRGDRGPCRVGRPTLADGGTDAHDRGAGIGHDHLHVGEVGVDESGHRDQVRNAPHTLQEHLVGHLEGVDHAGLVVRDSEEPVVRDDDEGVDLLLEDLDPLFSLHGPAPALEREGPRHDSDGQCAQALGDLGHHRGCARPGATALAGGDENHVGALECLFDFDPVLLGGQSPHLGVAAGSKTAGELAPDVELQVRIAHEERLGVGVGRNEFDVAQTGVDHPVDRIDTAATDPDDLDHCQVVALGRHGRHELPRPRVDRRPVIRWWFPPDVARGL